MARYNAQLLSSAAIAADTAFGWFGYVATVAKLRRVTLGVSTTTAVVPTSQQVRVGFNVTTGAAATATNATTNKLDSGSGANAVSLVSAWTTPPTLGATAADAFSVSFNTQSGADLPWELLEEWRIGGSTSLGIAFVNRLVALPSGHQISLSVEWEEL
jgi:hypothetical protein